MNNGIITIESVVYELPPHKISSAWIDDQIAEFLYRHRISDVKIHDLTGINERRFWDTGFTPSKAATLAGQKAIQKAGITNKDIGVLISTSVAKDYIEPTVASIVHNNLQLSPECLNFDVGNACLAFVNAINIVSLMLRSGQIEYGLIVDGESSREVVESTIKSLNSSDSTIKNYYDNFATLTLGSGAAAMVLTNKKNSRTGHQINSYVGLSDTKHVGLCYGQREYMITNAQKLLQYGVELAYATWCLASEKIEHWNDESINHYICHQVSQKNIDSLSQKLSLTHSKNQFTFPFLGNTGPASIPITLAMAEEKGALVRDDHIGVMGIGSGLNCIMMSITW